MSGRMGRKLLHWEIAGFVVTGAAGPLLHFAYAWSGENSLIAAFAAVNESTWEHMKLLFVPLLVVAAAAAVFGGRCRGYWTAKLTGALAGLLLGLGTSFCFFGLNFLWILLPPLLFVVLWDRVCRMQIGGATGDTIGACEQLLELLVCFEMLYFFS